ncbi:putative Transposase-associated domain-containing protein [Helianthus annuus]|nr:putative Transposase-associated domain-containing protein [Helianthus annuus]
MSRDRNWMYMKRTTSEGLFDPTFQRHVNFFLDYAYANAPNIQRELIEGVEVSKIRCPCGKCQNRCFKKRFEVVGDLFKKGFMDNYKVWYAHGESFSTQDVGQCSNPVPSQHAGQDTDDNLGEYTEYNQMVMESMPHQEPNQTAQAYYTILSQANEPLWDGCKNASTLSTVTRLLNWKSECNISDSAFDKLLLINKEILPDGAKLPTSFYEIKKMLKLLELPSERIHVCKNHCMLFNGQNSDLNRCTVCGENRYKQKGNKVPKLAMTYMPIAPRLQRLFYSKKTAQHLTWHANHRKEPGKMSHPSEGQAWNHFDLMFPDFAQETRNIRVGLCTDGFSPNNTIGKDYSCWPVFITVYNLPPWLALKDQYVQLPVLIPGPKNNIKYTYLVVLILQV